MIRHVNREAPRQAPPPIASLALRPLGAARPAPAARLPADPQATRRTTWLVSAGFSAMGAFVATPILVGPLGLDVRWVCGLVGGSLAVYASSLVAGHLTERPLAGAGPVGSSVLGGERRRGSRAASGGRLGRDVAPALATKTH